MVESGQGHHCSVWIRWNLNIYDQTVMVLTDFVDVRAGSKVQLRELPKKKRKKGIKQNFYYFLLENNKMFCVYPLEFCLGDSDCREIGKV